MDCGVNLNGHRIAGRVAPSASAAAGDDEQVTIDMIEFSQREVPLTIGACASTGNLAVAASNVVQIYRMVTKFHECSRAKFLDFEDCVHVFHTFPSPREIQLCEDVLACLSDAEVHVFKVRFSSAGATTDLDRGGGGGGNLRSVSLYSVSSEASSASSGGDNNQHQFTSGLATTHFPLFAFWRKNPSRYDQFRGNRYCLPFLQVTLSSYCPPVKGFLKG